MKVIVIGLGKMGFAIASRLLQAKHTVYGFDVDKQACNQARSINVNVIESLGKLPQDIQVIWLMLPAGNIIDSVLATMMPQLQSFVIVVDGGNSHFTDSSRRAQQLQEIGISYLDCGTSGGIAGQDEGFSLMIGGDERAFKSIEPLCKVIAASNGYGYVGSSGAGHYVKMVHNGIEYALLQAYAEGFSLLHNNSHYQALDLAQITAIWQHGSIIRSWILQLAHNIFVKDQQFITISGYVGQTGTGKWTIQEAKEQKISVPLIEKAVEIRDLSEKTGGDYATKIVALLRHEFGGHPIQYRDDTE